jgi:hypothetical protein
MTNIKDCTCKILYCNWTYLFHSCLYFRHSSYNWWEMRVSFLCFIFNSFAIFFSELLKFYREHLGGWWTANWKGFGRKQSVPRYYPRIFLEILRNTTKSAVGLRTTFPIQDVCNMKHASHYTGLQTHVSITWLTLETLCWYHEYRYRVHDTWRPAHFHNFQSAAISISTHRAAVWTSVTASLYQRHSAYRTNTLHGSWALQRTECVMQRARNTAKFCWKY